MIISLQRKYWFFILLFPLIPFTVYGQDLSKGKTVKTKPPVTITKEHLIQIAENFNLYLQRNSSLAKSSNSNLLITSQETKNWNIAYNRSNGTPRYISDIDNNKPLMKRSFAMDLENNALTMIASNQNIFKIKNPFDEFKLKSKNTDADNNVHLCFSQFINGIAIWGKEITFHFRSDGSMYSFTGNYIPTPDIAFIQSIDSLKAISIALNSVTENRPQNSIDKNLIKLLNYSGPVASKAVWLNPLNGKASVTWVVNIRPNFRDNWLVFIDIQNGAIVNKFNKTTNNGPVETTAKDLLGQYRKIFVYKLDSAYYMIDASRPIWSSDQTDILNAPKGALWTVKYEYPNFLNLISTDNIWRDSIAVSAHFNAGLTFDYFYNTFKRKSFDDLGATIMSVVHYSDWDGGPYDNAFWNGKYVAFGDGVTFKPFAGGLDVVAHEITHAVVQYTVDLVYQFQSGALNESFADIFASMVDRNDWLIGEDISPNGLPLRNMANPEQCGQPSHMKDYFYLDWGVDNGGVHYNCGIPNNAFYRLANDIGKCKAEQIFYKILTSRYLNSLSEFIDLRYAAIQAAKDLYNSGDEVAAVEKSFDSVGILPDSIELLCEPLAQGSSWIAAIHKNGNSKKLHVMPAKKSDSLPKYLTLTSISSYGRNPFCISKDGDKVIFIDYNNDIRGIDLVSSNEYLISTDGYWSSLALSPDGKQIAASTTMVDSSIYIFDISQPSESRTINLNSFDKPLPEIVIPSVDAIEWSKDGNFLLFDCSLKNTATFDVQWNIGLLNLNKNSLHFPLAKNENSTIYFCNPSFAKSNDNLIIFEYRDYQKFRYETQTLDLSSGKTTIINSTDIAFTYPVFCDNDSAILYENVDDNSITSVWKMSANGTNSSLFALKYEKPLWFSVGNASNVITFKKINNGIFKKGSLTVKQGDANLMFTLNQDAEMSFMIFDSKGRKVASIPASSFSAGAHTVSLTNFSAGKTLSSGFYFCKCLIQSHKFTDNKTFPFSILH